MFHRQRLVGSFMALDDGLQMFPGGSQFLFQIDEFVSLPGFARLRRFLRRNLLDQYEEIRPFRVAAFHRNDFQIDCLRFAVLGKADTFPANRGLLLFRPVKRRVEIQRQFFPHQFQHMEGCGSSRRRQVGAGVPLEMKDMQARVYHQRCRGVSLPDDALDGFLKVERGARQLRRGGARRRFCAVRGRQGRPGDGRCRVPRINLELALLLDKKMRGGTEGLRFSQQKKAGRLQGVMEEGEHPLLKRRTHVNQYIAATDEIELGERRILAQVMPGKHAPLTDLLADLVAISHFHKEALQTLRGDIGHRGFRVCAGPCPVDGRRTDVGAENLESGPGGPFVQEFQKCDRKRVHLLARGASRNPYAKRLTWRPIRHQLGEHLSLQCREHLRFPEKAGYVNKNVLVERRHLERVLLQVGSVTLEVLDLLEDHPARDAPLDRSGFVKTEVDPRGRPQNLEDLLKIGRARQRRLHLQHAGGPLGVR